MIFNWIQNCIESNINPICVHQSYFEDVSLHVLQAGMAYQTIEPTDIMNRLTADVSMVLLPNFDLASDSAWDSLLISLESPKAFYIIFANDVFWIPESVRSRFKAVLNGKNRMSEQNVNPTNKSQLLRMNYREYQKRDGFKREYLSIIHSLSSDQLDRGVLELYRRILRSPSINVELQAKSLISE